MPTYYKQDPNPKFGFINFWKGLDRSIRIEKRKRRIEKNKEIMIVTDDIYTHKIDTKNMFKSKKE